MCEAKWLVHEHIRIVAIYLVVYIIVGTLNIFLRRKLGSRACIESKIGLVFTLINYI
jgi:hypothetical protein